MNWAVWGPPIIVMAVGLLLGLIVVLRSKGQVRTDSTVDLWAKKNTLVDQLRALQADKQKLDPQEWQQRWTRLLDEAASALRDAEQAGSAPPTIPDPSPAAEAPAPSTRWVWMAVVSLFFVGLGALLNTATQQREEGGIMTGGALITGTPIEKTIEQLQDQAQADPSAIEPRNQLAHIAIQQGDMSAAMQWIDQARAIDPEHPDLRTNLAILQISIGMVERAKAELDAALTEKPQSSKALLWRGIIDMRLNQRETAIERLESALENASNREERMMASSALSEARKPPPTVQLRGTITLEAGLVAPKSGVLFVMVRRTAEGNGPPVAALRLSPSGIPGAFAVTDRDMMLGGPWPEEVWVSARVDTDGNPTTKEASDLVSPSTGPFGPGDDGVELILHAFKTVESDLQSGNARLRGTIDLADGISTQDDDVVFVIVRSSDTTSGPPLASVKINPTTFPTPFSIGDEDIMMGGTWPEQVWITARTDGDGNAMTRDDQDATSPQIGPLAEGTEDIVLLLGRD